MLPPYELWCTLLSSAPPLSYTYTDKLYTAPYWATLHPTDLNSPHPFLKYAEPSELHCTLWATQYPTELRCILFSNAALHHTLLLHWNVGLSVTTVSQSGTGMLRYHTEMLDAGMPMLAAWASLMMPSYDNMTNILKNLKLKIDTLGYCLTVLRPSCRVDKQYGDSQIVWSPFPYHMTFRLIQTVNRT